MVSESKDNTEEENEALDVDERTGVDSPVPEVGSTKSPIRSDPAMPSVADNSSGEVEMSEHITPALSEKGLRVAAPDLGEGWADRWWLWALAGLAFAAFIGALHIIT